MQTAAESIVVTGQREGPRVRLCFLSRAKLVVMAGTLLALGWVMVPDTRGDQSSVIGHPIIPGLEEGWAKPPLEARLRAYWWWLNGNVTKAAITRDLEEMKAKGFGGALICDAGGAEQDGNDRVPHGPDLFHRRNGASCTSTPCAKPTGSGWR